MIALALITATGVYAQKGFEDGSRYGQGEDSIEALRAISIYREFVKTENYKDAYEQGWKQVFHDAPLSTAYLYTDGVKIMQSMYNEAKAAKDNEKMAQYSEELFKVYEQRLQYLDKLNARAENKTSEGDVWGQYGHSYLSYNPRVSVSRAYELLSKAVEMTKGKTNYYVLRTMNGMKMSGSGLRHITSQFVSSVGCSEKKYMRAITIPATPWIPMRV